MTTFPILQNIPCTLVTGFLGAGKTTLINQLLSTKPEDQRWALLINEFGRIGIDGVLLANAQKGKDDKSNIAISEVSGGCICCTSQLPLQIALTRLLGEHRPQRLIIEPTGLAHPHELIRQLNVPHWQTALSMQAIITVLSGAQWQQEKYRTHDGFQAHVRVADILVINRYQQLSTTCWQSLQQWIATLNTQVQIIWAASDKEFNNELLTLTLDQLTAQFDQPNNIISQQRTAKASSSRISLNVPRHLGPDKSITAASDDTRTDNELPYRYHDEQQGMLVGGWRLPSHWIFVADDLKQWLLQLPNWQRIKGIVHTSAGWQQLNFTPDSFTTNVASAQVESRLEVILLGGDSNDVDSVKAIKDKEQQQKNWTVWDHELMTLLSI